MGGAPLSPNWGRRENGCGGHQETEGGPPDGTAAGKAGHWLPGVTSGRSPRGPPSLQGPRPMCGRGFCRGGGRGADTTHVWRVVQLGNKLEQNFIFSSSEADLGVSAPLLSLTRREVTTDVSMKRSRRHRGQTGPGSPFPFGSVLVLAADQSSGQSDGGPGGWTPGRPSLAVSVSQT